MTAPTLESNEFNVYTPNASQKIILNPETLKKLQAKDDKSRLSRWETISKYYNNDLYTEFEKKILSLKPNDCSIIQKFSKIETFPIENHPRLKEITLNTVYSDHPLREFHKRSIEKLKLEDSNLIGLQNAKDQLQKIEDLPLLVFIHGLGGQLSQFEPILQEFRNCSDFFGIDLPGFGNSKFPSRNDVKKGLYFDRLSEYTDEELEKLELSLRKFEWEDFKTESVVDYVYQILMFKFPKRKFILISHSMGSHISIKLINKLPENKVESIIILSPPKLSESSNGSFLNTLPLTNRIFLNACNYFPRLFDMFRMFDRYGGLYSKSVNSFIFPETDDIFKRLTQFRWNLDTDSNIFLKYLYGFSPITKEELISASKKIISNDKSDNGDHIINNVNNRNNEDAESTKTRILICCGDNDKITPISTGANKFIEIFEPNNIGYNFEKIQNSNHSVFLDRPYLLSGTIYKFIEELDLNISCAWVLKVKAIISGDKWGLKNKEKWDKVITISDKLINTADNSHKAECFLRGMKTLRQSDEIHNPTVFEKNNPLIFGIVDIGSDTPSYDPEDFKRIKYVKFKTESKVIPDNVTIVKFIDIVDKLLKERENKHQYIAVHCHYGQNRTGFLICCYLIERLGWSVTEAIKAFEIAKPPGIRHQHFKNALYLRYGE